VTSMLCASRLAGGRKKESEREDDVLAGDSD